MRPLLLLIALVSAGAALWLWLGLPAGMVLQGTGPVVVSEAAPPVVLVAVRELPAGRRLAEGDVGWAKVPAGVQRDGLTRQDQMPDADDRVLGLILQQGIAAGQPVVWGTLASRDEVSLSARIAPGKFAFAIVVSEATAAGGLILPGDRIDLLVADGRAEQAGQTTSVLVSDVPVLAVDQTMTRPSADGALPARTLTLELDQEMIDIVSAATLRRGLLVALRSAVPAP